MTTAFEIVPVSLRNAQAFVNSLHRHNKAPNGHKFSVGVSHDGELKGVGICGLPVARGLMDGVTLEVTRVCVTEDSPMGSCSALYRALWRAAKALGYKRLITYTLQSESGASLRGAGFRCEGPIRLRRADGWCNREGRESQPVIAEPKLRWAIP